jgi:hypothetical protein
MMLRHLRAGFVLLAILFCTATLAANAGAAPTGAITPYIHCTDGSETVPAGQLIVIRTSWVTYSAGLAGDFIKNQKIEWTLYGASPELAPVLAMSGPQDFGSLQSWTEVGQVTRSIDGHKRNVYEWLYGAQTAIALAAGQAVRLEYTFQVKKPLADGLGANTPAGTVYSTSSCIITAV